MRILVNHLTRMGPGYICVAGIDLTTISHVRPVLAGRLGTDLLRRNGGPFDLGCMVDIGRTRRAGRAPEVEDHRFDPTQASFLRVFDPAAYWKTLKSVSCSALVEIFGDSLEQRARSCTVDVGMGIASLGCLSLTTPPALYVDNFDKIRMNITDGRYAANLSVTDLRLYGTDHRTPRKVLIRRVARRIEEGESPILSVGLTRPFMKTGGNVRRHWLQVNNIHLKNAPIWNENLR